MHMFSYMLPKSGGVVRLSCPIIQFHCYWTDRGETSYNARLNLCV